MINKLFEKQFPFAHNYFSNLLESERKFPQSILLEGADTKSAYYFALELARILNCTGNKTPECECINCKWIKSYTHPAINNVSQIHFKPDDDDTKTKISVKQAAEIEKNLTVSSDYHRFFIFFSSKEITPKSNDYGYNEADFSIEPLVYDSFSTGTINALLKSVEEPPENTTFVFLVKSREDILPTIVSRSQVFKFSTAPLSLDYSDIKPYLPNYFNLDYLSAINLAESFLSFEDIELALNKLMTYLKDIMIQNIQNAQVCEKINRDIGFITHTIKQLKAKVQPKVAVETLFLKIARGY